jgi:hypothetical protein
MNEMSKTTTVVAPMAINRGLRFDAPTSEMYLEVVSTGFHDVEQGDMHIRNVLGGIHGGIMRFAFGDPCY